MFSGHWTYVASVAEVEILASVSSDEESGRRYFAFGWRGDDPGVWEVHGELLQEDDVARTLWSDDWELLSDLSEPYRFTVTRNGSRMWVRLRMKGS